MSSDALDRLDAATKALEVAIVHALLNDPDAGPLVRGILGSTAPIWSDAHAAIVGAVFDLHDAGQETNFIAVTERLQATPVEEFRARREADRAAAAGDPVPAWKLRARKASGGPMVIPAIMHASEPMDLALGYQPTAGLEDHCRRLVEIGHRRQLAARFDALRAEALDPRRPLVEVAAAGADAGLAVVEVVQRSRSALAMPTTMAGAVVAALDRHDAVQEARARGGAVGATWGVKSLDRLMPLAPASLYLLSASESGRGKSTIALAAAEATAVLDDGDEDREAARVQILDLENGRERLGARWLAMRLAVSQAAVAGGWLTPAQSVSARALSAQWEAGRRIRVVDMARKLDAIRAEVEMAHRRSRGLLRLVVVDHVGLIEHGARDPLDGMARITRTLCDLKTRLGVTVLALCQMTRSESGQQRTKRGTMGDYREPTLAGLRWGAELAHACDGALAIWPQPAAEGATLLPTTIVPLKRRDGGVPSRAEWPAMHFDTRRSAYREA